MRWVPVPVFLQTLVDTKNSARVVPGVYETRAHDYRGELARFMDVVLDSRASEEQMSRIKEALRQLELRRADRQTATTPTASRATR
jgi:hypothetical protein